jgi:hypothetical protein
MARTALPLPRKDAGANGEPETLAGVPLPSYFDGMSNTGRPPPPPEIPTSAHIADAVADVMRDVAVKVVVREEALAPLDRPPSAIPWIALGLLTIVSLYLWFGSPSFLATGVVEPLPPALQEAGARMEIHLQALTVEEFLQEEGRLPNSLSEAGEPFTEVGYERLDRRSFRLWVQGPAGIIEFASGDSVGLFLGDAKEVILRGVGG